MTQEIDYLNRSKVASLRQKGCKIVGFGAGILGLKTINYLDNPFEYFIDNSEEKASKGWVEYTDEEIEVPVNHFSVLEEEEISKLAIVLCSEHYQKMAEQLSWALPGVLIYKSPLLKDFETFSKLLNSSDKILVSSYGGAGGLYLVNSKTGEYQLLKSGSFRGITTFNDKIFVANEHGDIIKIKSFDPFSGEYILKQSERTNTHGILYWSEIGKLFVTETLNDCISVYEIDSSEKIDEIPLSGKNQQKGRNYHHVNDICVSDGKLYLSVISKSGNFYNDYLDGVIYELDYKNNGSLVPVAEGLLFPHAVMDINGMLYCLNSFNGDLLSVKKERLINLPGFIRGMDVYNGLIYIGQSRHRRLDMAKKYFEGVSMDSGLYIVDPESTMHRFVHLPEMCDVFNIKVLT